MTARRITIFGRTVPGHICSLFFSFSKSGRRKMLNLLFNTLLTITPHNTQKRRRRKERTTYGPLRRYSRWVVSKTKHSKTKTEARSTQISKTKHPNLENEAPKTRKRSTQDRKRSTQISKTKHPKLENEAP